MKTEKVVVTKRSLYYFAWDIFTISQLVVLAIIAIYDKSFFIIWFLALPLFLFISALSIPHVLAYTNEKIFISDEGITHITPNKKRVDHSWGDVKILHGNLGWQYSRTAGLVIEFYDHNIIKIPYFCPGYYTLKTYLNERGIFGMFTDSILFSYLNMDNHTSYTFNEKETTQEFNGFEVDISDVIEKSESGDYIPASYLLNQKTNIGMYESFLYIREIKWKKKLRAGGRNVKKSRKFAIKKTAR